MCGSGHVCAVGYITESKLATEVNKLGGQPVVLLRYGQDEYLHSVAVFEHGGLVFDVLVFVFLEQGRVLGPMRARVLVVDHVVVFMQHVERSCARTACSRNTRHA